MGSKRSPLNPVTFRQVKVINKHKWTWVNQQARSLPRSRVEAYCRCDCGTQKWVLWSHIRLKLSSQCRKCNRRALDFSEVQKKINDSGGTWHIQNESKVVNGRRHFKCFCKKCGRHVWRQWSAMQQGRARSCRVCSMRGKRGAHVYAMPKAKKSLYLIWHSFSQPCNRRYTATKTWKSFEEFEKWALSSGYTYGKKLYLKNRQGKHYSPATCEWKQTKLSMQTTAEKINFQTQTNTNTLPLGVNRTLAPA